MGAKLSRKKSEVGIGAETISPSIDIATSEDSPVTETMEKKNCEDDASTSVLQTIAQAVGESVSAVTEQISEDVVNKGIEAVESALASVSLIGKVPAVPEEKSEPVKDLAASDVLQEPSFLDDLLKSPISTISEAFISGVSEANEAVTLEKLEDKSSNPAADENHELLESLNKVETPSLDLLDCKLTNDSSLHSEDMGQNAVDNVNLI